MMNHANGWMSGWASAGMGLWIVAGIIVVGLLAIVMSRLSKK